MSIWADIHRRSNGIQERKEDTFQDIDDMVYPNVDFSSLYPKIIFSATYDVEIIETDKK